MKHLILLRHAKSSWKNSTLDDADRPLAERGERDAPHMAARLKNRGAQPTLLLTSPARRALRTAEIVGPALGLGAAQMRTVPELYLASPNDIRGVLATQDDAHDCVLLVGHNPGLTELVNELLPGLALDNLPTSGVVGLELANASWSAAARLRGRLEYLDYPKNPASVIAKG
jgi:phosphohistidine phosphatase